MHPKHNQTTKFEWTATHNFSVLGIILLYFKSGTISHTQFVGGDVSSTLNILFDKSKFNCIIANNNCAFWEHMLFMFFLSRYSLHPCAQEVAAKFSSWRSTETLWWTGDVSPYSLCLTLPLVAADLDPPHISQVNPTHRDATNELLQHWRG